MNDILSPDTLHSLALLWKGLLWPLLRLLLGLCVGLLLANLLEALRWTRHLARLATPLARAAHLRDVAGAAFSLAFVSPAAANGLLSESHQKGEIDGRELMLANLFNSFPAYLVHTPTIFLLTWPVLGWPAVVYVGLTLLAAVGRTGLTIAFSRRLLPAPPQGCLACTAAADGETGWRAAARKAWKRFRRRVPKLVCFTVPVYIIMYLLQRYGLSTRERGPLADKNRYAPWTGATMQGRMDLTTHGDACTLLRETRRAASPLGEFSCTYTGTGTPVPGITGQNAGEVLLGVPREVFERSAFIRQSGLAITQDAGLERRVASLISSGDEDTSYTEAYDALKKQLNRRRFNKSGQLPALEAELAEVKSEAKRS